MIDQPNKILLKLKESKDITYDKCYIILKEYFIEQNKYFKEFDDISGNNGIEVLGSFCEVEGDLDINIWDGDLQSILTIDNLSLIIYHELLSKTVEKNLSKLKDRDRLTYSRCSWYLKKIMSTVVEFKDSNKLDLSLLSVRNLINKIREELNIYIWPEMIEKINTIDDLSLIVYHELQYEKYIYNKKMTIIPLKTEFDEMNRMRKLSSLSLITEEYYYQNILNEDKRYDFLSNTYKDKLSKKWRDTYIVNYSDNELSIISDQNLKKLIKGDPTSKIENEEIIKTGKYSQWIVKQYLLDETGRFFEDLYKITNDLKIFDKIKHKLPQDQRDINNIQNPLDLYNIIKPYKELDLRLKSEKKGDIITLLNDNDYHVLIPKTKEAACSYGEETRWCTASPGLNYFENYTKDGPLYIILHKK